MNPDASDHAAASPAAGPEVRNDPAGTNPPRWRTELRALAELLAISGLAITQPLLDIFGRAPDHLIFRDADRSDILLFALIVTFAVPVGAWLLEMLVGLVRGGARATVHSLLLGVLTAIALTQVLDTALPRIVALVLGTGLAVGFVVLHRRTRGPRIWLAFLSPAPIAFLALFLLASPVAPLLRNSVTAIDAEVRNPTRTVIVVVDEFPLNHLLDEDGHVDAGLFPNFAALADTSTWFRQTTTVANTTDAAVPAMFTGNLPSGRLAPSAESHPDNLFTLVADAMPVTTAERVTRLCPDSICERIGTATGGLGELLRDARHVLGHRLDPTDPDTDILTTMIDEAADASGDDRDEPAPADSGTATSDDATVSDPDEILPEFLGDGAAGRFERFVDGVEPEPGLHMFHLVLPHGPYRLLPDGTAYPVEDRGVGRIMDLWFRDPAPVAVARQRQLLQTQRVDALIGSLRRRLEDRDLWDGTNVVVIADHGINFTPGNPARGVRADLIDDADDPDSVLAGIAWVPFFVKAAGQTNGAISDDPVRIVDLTPTVADLLDVDIPWEADGRSAFDGGSGDPDRVVMQINDLVTDDGEVGPDREIDRAAGWERVTADSVARFAPGRPDEDGSARIHRVGPRPDLWGEPVPDGLDEIPVDIDEKSRADDVDTRAPMIPAFFFATTDADEGTDVAVAVDGTIWATTSVHVDEGRHRIAAILPLEAFRDGANDLTVHRLPESRP